VVSLDEFAVGLGEMEISIPTEVLGTLEPGDRVGFRWLDPDLAPASGPGAIQVPDVSNVEIRFEAVDPIGDDTGTGSYTYATDGVFAPGSYDLTRFTAGVEGDDVVFSFEVDAAVRNPWGSPVGLSIQTFDLYIDTDPGAGTGARLFIDGRNAALGPDDGWETALTIEGWDSALYLASADGMTEETKPTIGIVTLAEKGKVLVRVPAELLPSGDPAAWGYAVAVMGQEGFPSGGVRRIRDVNPTAEQWRFGGAPADSVNHTRVMDLVLPEEGGVQGGPGEQARLLSEIPSFDGTQAEIEADDVALVPLVMAP
jgi:carbohydrate-binding DOMON domain-containing protein